MAGIKSDHNLPCNVCTLLKKVRISAICGDRDTTFLMLNHCRVTYLKRNWLTFVKHVINQMCVLLQWIIRNNVYKLLYNTVRKINLQAAVPLDKYASSCCPVEADWSCAGRYFHRDDKTASFASCACISF